MKLEENAFMYLWVCVVIFVTFLLLGSFIVSKNYVELAYLIILYSTLIIVKILNIRRNKNLSRNA